MVPGAEIVALDTVATIGSLLLDGELIREEVWAECPVVLFVFMIEIFA